MKYIENLVLPVGDAKATLAKVAMAEQMGREMAKEANLAPAVEKGVKAVQRGWNKVQAVGANVADKAVKVGKDVAEGAKIVATDVKKGVKKGVKKVKDLRAASSNAAEVKAGREAAAVKQDILRRYGKEMPLEGGPRSIGVAPSNSLVKYTPSGVGEATSSKFKDHLYKYRAAYGMGGMALGAGLVGGAVARGGGD